MISLEDFKMVARRYDLDVRESSRIARSETSSDMLFLEAQPFEREYSQSQQAGGGGGGGGDQDEDRPGHPVVRRKSLLLPSTRFATAVRIRRKEAENAKFLGEQQGKLAAQTLSLAARSKSRELSGTNAEFQSFTKDMEAASQAMTNAAGKLKSRKTSRTRFHPSRKLSSTCFEPKPHAVRSR